MSASSTTISEFSQLKIQLAGATNGNTCEVTFAMPPAWADIASRAQILLDIPRGSVAVTYVDEDGDEITVSSEDELQLLYKSKAAQALAAGKESDKVIKLTVRDLRGVASEAQPVIVSEDSAALREDNEHIDNVDDSLEDFAFVMVLPQPRSLRGVGHGGRGGRGRRGHMSCPYTFPRHLERPGEPFVSLGQKPGHRGHGRGGRRPDFGRLGMPGSLLSSDDEDDFPFPEGFPFRERIGRGRPHFMHGPHARGHPLMGKGMRGGHGRGRGGPHRHSRPMHDFERSISPEDRRPPFGTIPDVRITPASPTPLHAFFADTPSGFFDMHPRFRGHDIGPGHDTGRGRGHMHGGRGGAHIRDRGHPFGPHARPPMMGPFGSGHHRPAHPFREESSFWDAGYGMFGRRPGHDERAMSELATAFEAL